MQALRYIAGLILTATLFCGVNHAKAEEKPKRQLVIASFSFPPLLHLAEDGSFSGTMGETVRALCEDADVGCSFKVIPLARAYAELKQGSVDALITLDLGQFDDCCSASDWHSEWSAGLFSTNTYKDIPSNEREILGQELIVVNGMRSPYSFLPNMDALAAENKIKLFKARDVETAVLMFAKDRVGLMWGGEDFRWYLRRLTPGKPYAYRPLFRKNVVLWVHQQKADTLEVLNQAYHRLVKSGVIARNGLLVPSTMNGRYKEAALN